MSRDNFWCHSLGVIMLVDETGPFIDLELIQWARLAGQRASGICLRLPPQGCDYKHAPPCLRDLEIKPTNPYACKKSILLTELSPKPGNTYFNMQVYKWILRLFFLSYISVKMLWRCFWSYNILENSLWYSK